MNDNNLLRLVVMVLMAAGLFYVPLSTRSTVPAAPEPGAGPTAPAVRETDAGHRASLTGGDSSHGGDVPDAISLLADFANLDVAPAEILSFVQQSIREIPGQCRSIDEAFTRCRDRLGQAKGALAGLLMPDAGLSGPAVDSAKVLVECLDPTTVDDPRCDTTALTRASDVVSLELDGAVPARSTTRQLRNALATVVTGDATDEDDTGLRSPLTEALAISALKHRLTVDLHHHVTFLIATLADACDSYTGGAFDPALEAIRRAVEAYGYGQDRFFFPDWAPGSAPNQAGSQCAGTLHEQHPGVVLFSRAADRRRPPSLLVLFTVPETPTAGIHAAALVRAVRFISRWGAASPTQPAGPFRIVGPTFSGTSPSLARSIDSLSSGIASGHRFEIVSGSATSASNVTTLTCLSGLSGRTRAAVKFSSTTLPDDATIDRLDDFLDGIGVLPRDRALLFESNTSYGTSIREAVDPTPASSGAESARGRQETPPLGDACTESAETASDSAASNRQAEIKLTFPLHISRVRSLTPQSRITAERSVPADQIKPLAIEEAQAPRDLLPPLRPNTALPKAEMVLRNLLDGIRQERVRAVGVFATDNRDTLFLAQQLRRQAPDALLFTSENDVIFAHPSATPFTRGMLVVSSYPLYSRNQAWTGNDTRIEFPAMFAQGTYNATIVQMRDLVGDDGDDEPPLLEFGLPFSDCLPGCTPPAWISIVGRDRIWPVKAFATEAAVSLYTPLRERDTDTNIPISQVVTFRTPLSGVVLFVVLTIVSALHVLAFWKRDWLRRTPFLARLADRVPSGHMSDQDGVERWRSLLACYAALTLPQMAIAGLLWTWFVFGTDWSVPAETVWRTLLVTIVFAVVAGLVITTTVLACHTLFGVFEPLWGRRRDDNQPGKTAPDTAKWYRMLYRLSCLVVAAVAVTCTIVFAVNLGPHRLFQSRTLDEQDLVNVLLFDRTTALTSGVSFLVPLLCFAAAVYVWGAQHLCRLSATPTDGRQAARTEDGRIMDCLPTTVALGKPAGRGCSRSFPLTIVLALAAVMLVCVLALWSRRPVTVEGNWFNAAVFSIVVLLQMLMVVATIRLLFDRRTVQSCLDGLVNHPVVGACARLPDAFVAPASLLLSPRLSEAELLVDTWTRYAASQPLDSVLEKTFRRDCLTHGMLWRDSATRRILTKEMTPAIALGDSRRLAGDDRLEECQALQLVFGLRDAFGQMAWTALFIMVAALLLLAGHTLYPMQPRQTLLAITWANVGVAAIVGLSSLVAIDRDPVLSTITRTRQGAINWNWTLVKRVAMYVVLPLLGVIAAQFPELGGTLLHWIEPMQGTLF